MFSFLSFFRRSWGVLLSILRFGVSLLLPVIVFSCIPSFYPIYKVLIAPHLPELVQQFFSDLKGLFLSFCGLFLSGAVSTSSITHNNLSTVFSSIAWLVSAAVRI